jgi:hypothetical protein
MPLVDVTRWFTHPDVDWALRGRAFAQQFDDAVNVERGVYVYLDTNSSALPIYDRNGAGKVIVLGSATALKYGKFVGGLAPRMRQNYVHMHRRPPGRPSEDGIFPQVLSSLFVLDLSHRLRGEIRPIETDWNRSIRADLRARDLIHPGHRGRAETVNLARAISRAELLEIVDPIAARIAA